MQALVKRATGPGHLELIDVPLAEIGDGDVLLKVTYCGVCGSDLHIETGLHLCDPQVILGREYAGIISDVGANVTQFKWAMRYPMIAPLIPSLVSPLTADSPNT